jgi:RNA polymerase sigma-70 factor (ECF subfamily)
MKDSDADVTEKMEKNEKRNILYQALDSLPKKQKVAVTLNKLEELPYKEVAEIMDISVSETGVLINRGKKTLQKKMAAMMSKT